MTEQNDTFGQNRNSPGNLTNLFKASQLEFHPREIIGKLQNVLRKHSVPRLSYFSRSTNTLDTTRVYRHFITNCTILQEYSRALIIANLVSLGIETT